MLKYRGCTIIIMTWSIAIDEHRWLHSVFTVVLLHRWMVSCTVYSKDTFVNTQKLHPGWWKSPSNVPYIDGNPLERGIPPLNRGAFLNPFPSHGDTLSSSSSEKPYHPLPPFARSTEAEAEALALISLPRAKPYLFLQQTTSCFLPSANTCFRPPVSNLPAISDLQVSLCLSPVFPLVKSLQSQPPTFLPISFPVSLPIANSLKICPPPSPLCI